MEGDIRRATKCSATYVLRRSDKDTGAHTSRTYHMQNDNVGEDIHCPAACSPGRASQKHAALVTMATAAHGETTSLVHLCEGGGKRRERGDFCVTTTSGVPTRLRRGRARVHLRNARDHWSAIRSAFLRGTSSSGGQRHVTKSISLLFPFFRYFSNTDQYMLPHLKNMIALSIYL